MTIRAVIFDMDGVLIDAKEWHFRALNRALALFGYGIGHAEHISTFDGLPTRVKLDRLSEMRGLPRSLHEFVNEMKQAYTAELVWLKCRPTFAHQYALSRLKAEGYRLAVASNSIRMSVDLMMARAGLAEFLEFTLSNEDVSRPKPDPEIYRTAIGRLNLEPEQCLIVEDNPNGIAAARGSGSHVMVVRDPGDVTFESLQQALAQIGRPDTANHRRAA
ncbi:MAG: HAD family hydrolase [Planctomycetota bacterium]